MNETTLGDLENSLGLILRAVEDLDKTMSRILEELQKQRGKK